MDIKLFFSKPMYLGLAISIFSAGFFVNLVQIFCFIFIRPWNKSLSRQILYYCGYALFSQAVFYSRWWTMTKLTLYADPEDYKKYFGKEHSLCIMNHSCEIDWIVGNSLIDQLQMLGNQKAFIKKVVRYVPIMGWAFAMQEYVFLTRSYEKDKDSIMKQVQQLGDFPDPIWLLLFPEGTRFTAAKHVDALRFLKEKQLAPLHHHLAPRTKGFTTMVPYMRGRFGIYHTELVFKEDASKGISAPTIKSLLTGRKLEAHMYVRRIPMEEVPETEQGQEQFIRDLFYEKDKLQESFKKTGDFFATSGVKRQPATNVARKWMPLLNYLFWSVGTCSTIAYYLIKLFMNGDFIYLSVWIGIILACAILMNKAVGTLEVKPDITKKKE